MSAAVLVLLLRLFLRTSTCNSGWQCCPPDGDLLSLDHGQSSGKSADPFLLPCMGDLNDTSQGVFSQPHDKIPTRTLGLLLACWCFWWCWCCCWLAPAAAAAAAAVVAAVAACCLPLLAFACCFAAFGLLVLRLLVCWFAAAFAGAGCLLAGACCFAAAVAADLLLLLACWLADLALLVACLARACCPSWCWSTVLLLLLLPTRRC